MAQLEGGAVIAMLLGILLGILLVVAIGLLFLAYERNRELTDGLLHVHRLLKMQRIGFLTPDKASAMALDVIEAGVRVPGHPPHPRADS